MSAHNFLTEFQRSIVNRSIEKTATATLTDAEVMENMVVYGNHASSGIALTLPAAGAGNAGAFVMVVNKGAAAVTVVCTEDYGLAGDDTLTLSEGMFCIVFSDGSYWYALNMTVAA